MPKGAKGNQASTPFQIPKGVRNSCVSVCSCVCVLVWTLKGGGQNQPCLVVSFFEGGTRHIDPRGFFLKPHLFGPYGGLPRAAVSHECDKGDFSVAIRLFSFTKEAPEWLRGVFHRLPYPGCFSQIEGSPDQKRAQQGRQRNTPRNSVLR